MDAVATKFNLNQPPTVVHPDGTKWWIKDYAIVAIQGPCDFKPWINPRFNPLN